MVTHAQLSSGYQVAQTAHALAEFALRRPEAFAAWRNGYIVCLQTQTAHELETLYTDALANGHDVVAFREPDLEHEITAIAFAPSPAVKPLLSRLSLAGKTTTHPSKKGASS